MKAGFVFWTTECKKYIKIIPYILLESLLFGFLLWMMGRYASYALYGEKSMGVIRIGIVSKEESVLSEMLVNFVGSMESMEESCRFVLMEKEEADRELADGGIYAMVMLPEGMVEGILNGTNPSAVVVFGDTYSRMETAVFKELAGAGEKLLSTAQAGIYAADALCTLTGQREKIPEAERILNATYLEYALKRADLFDLQEVTATGEMTSAGYYLMSLLLVFLSFAGISMGRYASVRAEAFQCLMKIRGIGMARQYLLESLAFSCVLGMFGTVLALPFLQWYRTRCGSGAAGAGEICLLFVLFVVMGSFIRLVLEITGNSPGGMGAAFLFLLLLMVFSGLFLPSAFLPVWMEQAGRHLPYRFWMEIMKGIAGWHVPGSLLAGQLCCAVGCTGMGAGIYLLRSRLENGR